MQIPEVTILVGEDGYALCVYPHDMLFWSRIAAALSVELVPIPGSRGPEIHCEPDVWALVLPVIERYNALARSTAMIGDDSIVVTMALLALALADFSGREV